MKKMVMQQIDIASTEKILRKHKIITPHTRLVKTRNEAVKFSKRIGFPVVMKIVSKSIVHKTDAGGVKLSIQNEFEAGKAYDEIMNNAPKNGTEGVIVQKMHDGHKIIVGMKRDPQFGPVIAFGLGGIFVEILKDVTLRIAPLNRKECRRMIKEVKTYPILAGARGGVKANITKIVDTLMKASAIAMKEKNIKEFDFNPVIVNSKEATVVDARFLTDEA